MPCGVSREPDLKPNISHVQTFSYNNMAASLEQFMLASIPHSWRRQGH